jgi:hypothetical protein
MKQLSTKTWLAIFQLSPPGDFLKIISVEKFGKQYLILGVKDEEGVIDPDATVGLFTVYDIQEGKTIDNGFFALKDTVTEYVSTRLKL